MDKNVIIDKIKKLIALRDGARAIGSEGEANAAAAAIQRLLTAYNLEMSDIYSSDENEDSTYIGRSGDINTADQYRCGWKQDMLIVLSKFYYCKSLMIYGTSSMCIYGTDVNRLTVEYAFNFLTTVFLNLMPRRFREQTNVRMMPRQRDKWCSSYLLGCVRGVSDKLEDESTSTETGLMVCHNTMIDKYINQKNGEIGKWKSSSGNRTMLDGEAFMSGFNDGKNQNIAKAIN